jgi:hypothetical protein
VKPRTLFYRCTECGSEILNTIDLDAVNVVRPPMPPCHCGGEMREAPIPRLVLPEPGGDGHTYEVMELKDGK